jgi:SET domain-containing protein
MGLSSGRQYFLLAVENELASALSQEEALSDTDTNTGTKNMEPIRLFNQSTLQVQDCGAKGRGVVTTAVIPARTIIDISPILLFPSEEYSTHGKYTQLDHYTYRWKGGMALALGLGSMFNHSSSPNVGFQRDFDNSLIRYSTMREIQVGEELCISYGPNLWFPDMEDPQNQDKDNSNKGASNGVVSDSEDETAESFFSRIQLSDDDDDDKSNN